MKNAIIDSITIDTTNSADEADQTLAEAGEHLAEAAEALDRSAEKVGLMRRIGRKTKNAATATGRGVTKVAVTVAEKTPSPIKQGLVLGATLATAGVVVVGTMTGFNKLIND